MTETSAGRPLVKSVLAMVTLAVAIGLLVLAVMRWRENGWSADVWLVSFIIMFAIRAPFSAANRANVVVESRNDEAERALLIAMFLSMMVLPLLDLATPLLAFADYRVPRAASIVAAALQAPMLFLFWRSHADLGRNWSPGLEVREDHGLVTAGVYARVRHPMYAAIWIAAVTQPLLVQNWIGGALVVPAFAVMWIVRIPREEAMMRAQFGEAYDAYVARSGRLFPRLRR